MAAEKATAYVFGPVDADGVPLTSEGERWVETRPGVYVHPLAAAYLELMKGATA